MFAVAQVLQFTFNSDINAACRSFPVQIVFHDLLDTPFERGLYQLIYANVNRSWRLSIMIDKSSCMCE
jgi:hypothetical protein